MTWPLSGRILVFLFLSGVPTGIALAAQISTSAANYAITSVIDVVKPLSFADLNDGYQKVSLLSEHDGIYRISVTYFPNYTRPLTENLNWRIDDREMVGFLVPTSSENWDDRMRLDLRKALQADGIDIDRLTDLSLVKKVSRWAFHRSAQVTSFSIWCVAFPNDIPTIYPPLFEAFEREKRGIDIDDFQLLRTEVIGREMYYNRTFGSCTSYATYLTTILRALGIPTRMVICIPPFDPNDQAQRRLFYKKVQDPVVLDAVSNALGARGGFYDHVFNEVYIGHKWIRLNYDRLNGGIVDDRYLGLETHIFTFSSLSKADLAATWGVRYFLFPHVKQKLSSINPYRLIAVEDNYNQSRE